MISRETTCSIYSHVPSCLTRDDPVTEFSLQQYSSSKDVKAAIDKIVQKGGLSNVGE